MYDLIIIGAGPAGVAAAEYAGRHNLKTALVEKEALGGVCLNSGCIPTKTILHATKLLSQFQKSSKFGIDCALARMDLVRLNQRVKEVNAQLRAGLDFLVKSHKIDFISGEGRISRPGELRIGDKILEAKYILIACGSRPIELPKIKFDGKKIISSTEALNIQEIPKRLLIIGGGVIGCEFAEIFLSLGSEVEIVELTPNLLPGIDKEAARRIETVFKKRKARLSLGRDAGSLDFAEYDKVLLCVGRAPQSDCFGGIEIKKERNRVLVDEYLQTSIPNIYAAGDCIGGYMLAHAASYEGRLAVENMISGNKRKADYQAVPSCVYTNPEIACVGLSEEEARKSCPDVIIKRFDFRALGMAHLLDEAEGFVKVIADKEENILGACIAGYKASELIHVLTLALKNNLKLSCLRQTIFAHPTISEAIAEAVLH